MQRYILTVLLLSLSANLLALPPQNHDRGKARTETSTPSPRQVWAWTLEERIAARTDAAAARERVRGAARGKAAANSTPDPELSPTVDSFDGKGHPELFLPHEVFRTLIAQAFLGSSRGRELFRRGLRPEVQRHGLPADFWERLESLSAVYVADTFAEIDLGDGLRERSGADRARAAQALALKQSDACRSRAAAIDAARKQFGAERFDRFLYEVVAVNMFHVADRLPDPELLRQHARGCR